MVAEKEQAVLCLCNGKTRSFCSAVGTEKLKSTGKRTLTCYKIITKEGKQNEAKRVLSEPCFRTLKSGSVFCHSSTQAVFSTHQTHRNRLYFLLISFSTMPCYLQ